MRHVRISGDFETKTDHRRVVVEGRDCEDWMAVDIGINMAGCMRLLLKK